MGQRLGLDPIAGHLVLIPAGTSGRAARGTARRSLQMGAWCSPSARASWTASTADAVDRRSVVMIQGNHHWVDLWDEDDARTLARCHGYRRGRTHPANGTVRWREFAQYNSNNVLMPTWKQMPSHMLGKVEDVARAAPGLR